MFPIGKRKEVKDYVLGALGMCSLHDELFRGRTHACPGYIRHPMREFALYCYSCKWWNEKSNPSEQKGE